MSFIGLQESNPTLYSNHTHYVRTWPFFCFPIPRRWLNQTDYYGWMLIKVEVRKLDGQHFFVYFSEEDLHFWYDNIHWMFREKPMSSVLGLVSIIILSIFSVTVGFIFICGLCSTDLFIYNTCQCHGTQHKFNFDDGRKRRCKPINDL